VGSCEGSHTRDFVDAGSMRISADQHRSKKESTRVDPVPQFQWTVHSEQWTVASFLTAHCALFPAFTRSAAALVVEGCSCLRDTFHRAAGQLNPLRLSMAAS